MFFHSTALLSGTEFSSKGVTALGFLVHSKRVMNKSLLKKIKK